jgi:hypothetical protein
LLRFQSIQLSLLPINLGLLRLDLSLDVGVLLLPRLHLITNQRATEETDGGTDTGTSPCITGRAPDDCA